MRKLIGLIVALIFASVAWAVQPDLTKLTAEELNWWNSAEQINLELVLAEQAAAKSPTMINKRDLADALHARGHILELEKRYDEAFEVQTRSLELYKQSGFFARGSWGDGTEHAHEHIFMDTYDHAVQLDQEGLTNEALELFGKAFEQIFANPDYYKKLSRVKSRVSAFFRTQKPKYFLPIRTEIRNRGLAPIRPVRLFLFNEGLFPDLSKLKYRCEEMFQ